MWSAVPHHAVLLGAPILLLHLEGEEFRV